VCLRKIVRAIRLLNLSMFVVAAVVLGLLTLVIFYDAIARYFFQSPTKFGFDLSTWLSGVAAFLTGGLVLLYNEHIRVDIFYDRFPDRFKSVVDVISSVCMLMVVFVFVWYGGQRVSNLFVSGNIATSGFNIALWIKWIIVPIGGVLLGLQALVNLIRDVYMIFTGKRLWEDL
jgi:TRAP-type mannitol/chloroaromatic compound transport system permease small subunit